MCAKYIAVEKEAEKERLLYMESLPKLPVGQMNKALPKALKLFEKEDFFLENLTPCTPKMRKLLEFLVINNPKNNKFIVKDKQERKAIHTALTYLCKQGCFKMMDEYSYTIERILKMNLFWKRDITTWTWKSHNTYKQIKSLVEHLFCQFKVPDFMFEAWTDKGESYLHIEWFLQISDGQSARTLHKFPIIATRRMAHEFLNTPFPGYGVSDAVRRAQIIGLGGSPQLADAILRSRLRNNFTNNDFWESVFQFFINIPMLNLDEVGTVIDYINEMKFVPCYRAVNGQRVYGPLMPGFSMKGRNMATLIEDTHAWHKELGKESKMDLTATWPNSDIRPFTLEEGSAERNRLKIYELAELTTAKELHAEGKTMHHCVFSYLRSCIRGECSIFSLRLNGERMATIEVRGKSIVQVRAAYNKKPEAKAVQLISHWAFDQGLQITTYAYGRY